MEVNPRQHTYNESMRGLIPAVLITAACLAGGVAIASSGSAASPAPETHCAIELTAGDGSSSGAVTCFETESELNEAAGLTNPGFETSSAAPE